MQLRQSHDRAPLVSVSPEQATPEINLDFHAYKHSDAHERISGWREILRGMSEAERTQFVVRCPQKDPNSLFYLTFNSENQLAIAGVDRKNLFVLDDITITVPQTTIDMIESHFPQNLPPDKRPTLK